MSYKPVAAKQVVNAFAKKLPNWQIAPKGRCRLVYIWRYAANLVG
jgi:hypothetical protein